MKKTIIAFVALFSATAANGHTPAETNELVSAMLGNVLFFASDNWVDNAGISSREAPVTWPGFLGRDESHGWTLAEKKAAFEWYLSTLGTNDCMALRGKKRHYVSIAVDQCRVLNYVEAVPLLKAIALNPKGICRQDAMKLVIKFGSVDDTTTEFVETIITNVSGYSSGERVECYWEYAKKLQQDPCTNGTCASALSMFYRNRKVSGTGAATLDRLFSDKIVGYANSSNRLDTALSMLMVTNMRPQFVEYFVGVTNQLLSSGQPLPWINVGGGGN